MSVLVVANFLSGSGVNRAYTEELADRLEKRGRTIVRTSSEIGRVRRLLDMVATVLRRRREYSIALIDVFSGPSFVWAESVACELRLLGKPYVLTLHGGALPEFARQWPRRVRHLLQSAAFVTAPSQFLAERMRVFRADLSVVPNALDVGGYPFAVRGPVGPRLVWVRALHEIYNPVLAVDVLAAVAAKHTDVRLVMLGPDKDGSRRAVERRAEELGVRERLDLVGQVARDAIPEHLAGADIFLNTTNVDNTPLSVLEAMATGLCVVSTNVGGIPYLLRQGETGLLVPPGNARAMADAVELLLSEPALAARLSTQARGAAEEHSWERVLAKWDDVIDRVAPHA